MKLLTPQQIKEHDAATLRGAIEGTVGSGLLAVGGSYYLNRRWAYYRSLPPSLKLLGVIIVVAPSLAIQAERRGLEYDRSQWTGVSVVEMEREAVQQQSLWEGLDLRGKINDWASRHTWSIILGSWATSVAVAGTIISKDKLQTTAQKVVQTRMWAQGLTVGILIVAGILSQTQRTEAARRGNQDHSWASLLEEQERERKIKRTAVLPS